MEFATGFGIWKLNFFCRIVMDWHVAVFGFRTAIIPVAEHPGIYSQVLMGFIHVNLDFYYCDHDDHHIPSDAE